MKPCKHCKKNFTPKKNTPSQIAKAVYCSRQCANDARSKNVSKKCENCKETFASKPSKNQVFCSNKCKYEKGWKGKFKVKENEIVYNSDKYRIVNNRLIRGRRPIENSVKWHTHDPLPKIVSCCLPYY